MQILRSCAAALIFLYVIQVPIYVHNVVIDALKEPSMLFFTLMEIYRDWRRYNASVSKLTSLSDRELADIGISRADIYRVAWEKACKAA